MLNVKLIWICVIYLALAIFTRYNIATTHFTSWDDIYPGYIAMKIAELNRIEFLYFIEKHNSNLPTYLNIFPTIFLKLLSTPFYIAKTTAYAPLQYFLNPFLILSLIEFETTDYLKTLFIIRLQSFLFSIFYFILFFYFIIKKIHKYSEKFCLIFIGGTFFLTSWPFLTLSGHGGNYANLLFCILALILNMYFLMNTKKNKFFLLSGFTWILLVLTNYQIIFFLPASILTLFILKKDDLRKNLLNFIYLFISILISIFIMIFLLNLHGPDINFISSKGSNISKEYLFSNTNYSGLYGFVFFIVNNLTEVTYSVLAMCNIPENYHLIFIIFVYFFSILGIFNLYKNNKLVFYFTISSLVIFLLFFFLSILAFSPTRHIIWLLFFLGILISYGFNFFIELTKYKKIFYIAILILSVANFTLFFSEYSSIKKDREDPLLNLNIKEIISSNKINLIATYQLSYNLNFNPFVKKYFNQVYNRNGLEILIERNTKLKDYNNINLLLYCSNGEPCINKSDKQIYKIKNQIEKIFNKNFTNIVLQKNKSNNVITKTSETFGNFTINNRKVQIFEIYTLY